MASIIMRSYASPALVLVVGFVDEQQLFPGEPRPGFPPVIIHHKMVIIDAETPQPARTTTTAG